MVFYFTGTGNSLQILTYGNRHGGAAELADELCKTCGIQAAYINVVLMVDNWLPGFDMEEQKRLDKDVEGQLAGIAADVNSRRRWISPVTDQDRAAHQEFLNRMSQMPPDAWQHLLRVTEKCVGCGICEKVCPSGSIHVEIAEQCIRRATVKPAWPAPMPAPARQSS